MSDAGNSGEPIICGIRNSINDFPSAVSQYLIFSPESHVAVVNFCRESDDDFPVQRERRAKILYFPKYGRFGESSTWMNENVVRIFGNRRRPVMSSIARCLKGCSVVRPAGSICDLAPDAVLRRFRGRELQLVHFQVQFLIRYSADGLNKSKFFPVVVQLIWELYRPTNPPALV